MHFSAAQFEGGRHERRVNKMETRIIPTDLTLQRVDPEIADGHRTRTPAPAGKHRADRQREFHQPGGDGSARLGPDEQIRRRLPEEALVRRLRKRRRRRATGDRPRRKLFGAEHANVQPHSGSGANMAVYFAFLKPGDKMLTMDLTHGGHLTHGNKANFSGKFFEIVHYGVRKEDERIDYDQLGANGARAQAEDDHGRRQRLSAHHRFRAHGRDRPRSRRVSAGGHRAYRRPGRRRACIPSPVPHADFVTTTTHKTLRGPRGGLILCKEKYAKEIDSQAVPGHPGRPADARDCGQGGLLPGGAAAVLQSISAADRAQMRRRWPKG